MNANIDLWIELIVDFETIMHAFTYFMQFILWHCANCILNWYFCKQIHSNVW